MDMTNQEYGEYIKSKQPASPAWRDVLRAFAVGGLICALGQGLTAFYMARGLDRDAAGTAVSLTLVFLGALLTGLGVYDDIARFAGAGTLVRADNRLCKLRRRPRDRVPKRGHRHRHGGEDVHHRGTGDRVRRLGQHRLRPGAGAVRARVACLCAQRAASPLK